MIITRPDGSPREAVVLSQTRNTIRVVMKGDEDVAEFFNVHGNWISEDYEQVKIEFAWERNVPRRVPTEVECICSKELADQLIQLLVGGEKAATKNTTPEEDGGGLLSRAAGVAN